MPNDLNAQQVGVQRRAHATEPKANVLTGRSRFPMSYKFLNTSRYGQISPFYYQHVKGDDIVPLQSDHEVRTHTLASPMLSDVEMQKLYAFVPMEAIYPLNWERMLVNPIKGDDVPSPMKFGTSQLTYLFSQKFSQIRSYISGGSFTINTDTTVLRFILFAESVFSSGSLLSQFNIHLSDLCTYSADGVDMSFDRWFDTMFVPAFLEADVAVLIDGKYYKSSGSNNSYYRVEGETNPTYYIPTHRLLDMMRENTWTLESALTSTFYTAIDFSNLSVISRTDLWVNLEAIVAYQMCCWHFYSDSKVDFIWSADRYRSTFAYVSRQFFLDNPNSPSNTVNYPYFYSYNGEWLQHDVFSFKHLWQAFSNLLGMSLSSYTNHSYFLDMMSLLFTHRNSLRYGDYFVTGRTRPYGIGDTTVDVKSSKVSVIDITKKLQLQRFLNSVAWSSQKAKDYVRDVLGVQSKQNIDNSCPQFIANQRFPIVGYEVENTGANQTEANSITTIVKTKQSRFAFEFRPSNMGIIIGLRSYDVPRIYSKTFDRNHMSKNRFDDFIPEMQFVGDQDIKSIELNASSDPSATFAYTLRYMPMKIRQHYAAGGFIENLPSWAMITDNKDGNPFSGVIDPDYIRSTPSEFDRFYSSLTGYSLGSYFHFIHIDNNYQELTRDMVYAPEPLK